MKYLLDTNACVRYLNRRAPLLYARLQRTPQGDIAVCSIVKGELFAGAGKSQQPARTLTRQQRFFNQFTSLPFDDAAATIYGTVRSQLELAGTPIGPLDTLIAAIALANGLILVTHNTGEFGRVNRLQVEDWET
jgi:tRNA(fMet)-specific endonuclease VapC